MPDVSLLFREHHAALVRLGSLAGQHTSTAYVLALQAGTTRVWTVPIDTVTGKAGIPIATGHQPAAAAVTPNGKTVYVTNGSSNTVTPISTATNKAGPIIKVGMRFPSLIAITPGGKTAYVGFQSLPGAVVPIDTVTNKAGRPIGLPGGATAIVFTP